MKRTNLIFLVLVASIIFFGCSKDDCTTPEATNFTGASMWIADVDPGTFATVSDGKMLITGQVAEWYDSATVSQVTGKSLWTVNWLLEADWSSGDIWGTATLYVGLESGGNPANAKGVWEVTWQGELTEGVFDPEFGFLTEGIIAVTANGEGTSGEVKGKFAQWTYTMDISQGFVYNFTGSFLWS